MRLFHRVQNPTSNNAKVMIKGLHYCLHALTGNGLEQFIPDSVIPPGTPINVQLKSWSLRPCLVSIHDEESSRFRAMNFLAGPRGLRAYPEPEGSHPQWNDYLRAISTLLKATLLVNWSRRPFGSGTHHAKLTDAAKDLMRRKGADSFMCMMAEFIAADREISPEGFRITPQPYPQSQRESMVWNLWIFFTAQRQLDDSYGDSFPHPEPLQ